MSRTHVPMRLCIGCGKRAAQQELLRVARAPEGSLVVSGRGCLGRTGYLHRLAACWVAFAAGKGFVRSLGHAVDRRTRAAFVQTLQMEPSAIKR